MKSINDEASKKRKEELERLIKGAGFRSICAFAKEAEIPLPNLYSNLDGTFCMSIKRIFKIANMLGVPVIQILAIFYPDEMQENQSLL